MRSGSTCRRNREPFTISSACPPVAIRTVFGPKLIPEAFENAVDHSDRAIVQTRLHAGHRVRSDELFRLQKIDQRQTGGLRKQALNRDSDTWADQPAEVLTLLRNSIEGDCCSEVDDDAGAAVLLKRRDAVDDSIRAYLSRIVV